MAARKKNPAFEKSIEELEDLVSQLESGDLALEQALKTFEKGIKLSRDCQTALAEAEQKVSMLIEQNGEISEAPFLVEGSDDADGDLA